MANHICKNCVLGTTTPGIIVNPTNGLCQYCESFIPLSREKLVEYKYQLDSHLGSIENIRKYDVIMALSGGIDSSYALYRLKKEYPHLRVLAVQFDNGFISQTAFDNAHMFCKLTKSTYFRLFLDKKLLNDAFKKSGLSLNVYPGFAKYRASDICNTCMSIIKQKLIEIALQTKTPYIVFAFSPGQTEVPFVVLTPSFIGWIRKMFASQLTTLGVEEKELFLLDERILSACSPQMELTIIHPFLVWKYDKNFFRKECIRLGWIEPDINDPNTSNCLLNAFATKNHLVKYKIFSYAFDLSALVRQGNLKRDEAEKIMNAEFSEESIEKVRQILNFPD
jgi:tRNA(Ile)-lysidine synthase TilS/MesJ